MKRVRLIEDTVKEPVTYPRNVNPQLAGDFRNFVYATHVFLKLRKPTPLQYELCDVFTNEEERSVIMAFRGASKSHIAGLYSVWRLYRNKEEKILVVSATGKKARVFVAFCKKVIGVCPFLEHMRTSDGLSFSFNVAGVMPSQDYSLEARGITSQITGNRASIIIADDLEISTNSLNALARQKLVDLSSEFEDIMLPDVPDTKIIYAGTPHTSSSIYNILPSQGYVVYKFPVYDSDGNNVEPTRFSEENLAKRRLAKGESKFRLQYLLDTSLADEAQFPLKLSDLIVSNEFTHKACREEYSLTQEHSELVCSEAKGHDRLYVSKSEGHKVPMAKRVLALDPAGGGYDEFAWAAAGTRNGFIFIFEEGGWDTGLTPAVVKDINRIIKKYDINELHVETNYGGEALLKILKANVRIKIVPFSSTKNKEARIIGTLEPILNQRKLVVKEAFVRDRVMMAQYLNMTPVSGTLDHDDRIDVVEMAANALVSGIGINLEVARRKEEEARFDKELGNLGGTRTNHNVLRRR